jgi:hypothetical protein
VALLSSLCPEVLDLWAVLRWKSSAVISYLDMLQLFVIPTPAAGRRWSSRHPVPTGQRPAALSLQGHIESWRHIPQQAGWPRWNYRVAATVTWPRSYWFTFLGLHQGQSSCSSVPQSLRELQGRIRGAIMNFDEKMLRRIWDDVAFTWDLGCIARASHIEHLWTEAWMFGHCCGAVRFPTCEMNKEL